MTAVIKRQRKKGAVYCVVYQHQGKQIWETFALRRDALLRKAEVDHKKGRGDFVRQPDITFGELAEKWISAKEGQVRPKVYATYEPHVEKLIAADAGRRKLGDYRVKDLGREMVERLAAEITKGVAPATASRRLTILRSIFQKGIEWDYLSRNPAEFVKRPRCEKANIDFLEPDEIRRLIAATDGRHRCLMMFACFTGCRQSEILGLRWQDVDLAGHRVFIRQVLQGNQFLPPKTENSRRTVDLPTALVDELGQHQVRQAIELGQNPHDLVFTSQRGTPLASRNVTQRVLEPALKRAELRKVSFHSLRHSYVSMLINQGENVKTIQALVGHASARMTWDIYGHLFEGETRRAVERLQTSFFEMDRAGLPQLREVSLNG